MGLAGPATGKNDHSLSRQGVAQSRRYTAAPHQPSGSPTAAVPHHQAMAATLTGAPSTHGLINAGPVSARVASSKGRGPNSGYCRPGEKKAMLQKQDSARTLQKQSGASVGIPANHHHLRNVAATLRHGVGPI